MSQQTPEHAPETELQSFMHYVAQLRAEVSESVNGVLQRAARYVPFVGGAPVKVTSSPGVLAGYSLTNEEPDPSWVHFYDGDADGDLVLVVAVPGYSTASQWPALGGVNLTRGLYLKSFGSVLGTVFLRSGE